MSLPLGKLTILVGAGILGSVLAKEGRLSSVPDFVSGAFKIAFKQISREDSTSSSNGKPINASLMAQVNSLRQELQLLASNRPVTIVTASGTGAGAGKYGTIVLIVVVGYGYVWWKGWKLPDMMFATRRSLSDACTSIAQQLENVYASIRSTKRELSSNIEHLDSTLNEVAALTSNTREKVTELLEDSSRFDQDVRNVRQTVQTLGMKISRIEEKQVQRPLNATPSVAVQKSNGILGAVEISNSPGISNGIIAPEGTNNGSSSWFRSTYLTRIRSATSTVLHRTSSSTQQS
ncbi:DNA binding protein, putative [Ricinus communis]|uniref:DNA binding protein, putative n=1 Tax=Ricinus communis TaxID=3988 RepID=B9SYW5_RICCO|nr:DNA binding protein, putative [Ricinus communis]